MDDDDGCAFQLPEFGRPDDFTDDDAQELLRIMCVNGSERRSMTVLSTSVFSPSVIRRTSFPTAEEASRTIRDILWKRDFTGWARIIMTLS